MYIESVFECVYNIYIYIYKQLVKYKISLNIFLNQENAQIVASWER